MADTSFEGEYSNVVMFPAGTPMTRDAAGSPSVREGRSVNRGHPDDFATFYREQLTPMTRLAYLLVGSREVAQDLTQDAFVRVHAKWSSIEQPTAYLRRAVVNACNSHHRRKGVERKYLRAIAETNEPGEPDHLTDALAELPYRQRAVLVLRYYHDLSEAEIARTLGVRPGTVGSLASRGLDRLRTVIPR